ncbi:MAG: DUF2848 domain-containing protein [Burkholderiaceae bacterium]|jgi:hypothetical protein|nr:DUF2848 domain-containing protein [Burkholderiaceae bacterium]
MELSFEVASASGTAPIDVAVRECIVAGWAGRDLAAIEHHIDELAALGVPRPSAVPLYYRVGADRLTQQDSVEVVGDGSSGEAEVFVFSHRGVAYVSVASDHTDRKLETHSVALSKQLCPKPVARNAWPYAEVADHWDELVLRSWIDEDRQRVLYQEGTLASLRHPLELVEGHFGRDLIPDGSVMLCGTVAARGGIRPAPTFEMELFDPRLRRSIAHRYVVRELPEIS